MRETATLVPLAILVFILGLYPGPLMELMDSSVTSLVEQTKDYVPADLSLLRP